MHLLFHPDQRLFFAVYSIIIYLHKNKKRNVFIELKVEHLIIQNFNKKFSYTTHQNFYHDGLVKTLKAKHIIVGEDFHFGHHRKGDLVWLEEQCKKDNIKLNIIKMQTLSQQTISSSSIRQMIKQEGAVDKARKLLGHPYFLEGTIVEGKKIGREIGVPTINLDSPGQVLPAKGVYAGFAWIADHTDERPSILSLSKSSSPVVINVGERPTVSQERKIIVEGHILSGLKDKKLQSTYGKKAGFYLYYRLRDEKKKFSGLAELQDQIQADCSQAKKLLSKID